MGVDKITKRIVREMIKKYLTRKKWKNLPSEVQGSIHCGTLEIDGSNGLPIYI